MIDIKVTQNQHFQLKPELREVKWLSVMKKRLVEVVWKGRNYKCLMCNLNCKELNNNKPPMINNQLIKTEKLGNT